MNNNAANCRMIRVSSDGAISFFPPTTFHNAYFDCLPDEHAVNWHVKVRAVVKTELNNTSHVPDVNTPPPAVLVSYDDAPANVAPEQHIYTAYYMQILTRGLETPLPTNIRHPPFQPVHT